MQKDMNTRKLEPTWFDEDFIGSLNAFMLEQKTPAASVYIQRKRIYDVDQKKSSQSLEGELVL